MPRYIQTHSARIGLGSLAEESSVSDTSSKSVTTKSKPSAFPSALRSKRSAVQTLNESDLQTEATIRQTCEKCGRQEMRYYTLQLRSADEGSTVFFSCECGHKYAPESSHTLQTTFWLTDDVQIQRE